MRSLMGSGRWWLMVVLSLVAVLALASLGRWQWGRAEQKLALQQSIDDKLAASVLTENDFVEEPALWGELHRRVSLQGFWMHRHTLFLDNRLHQGRPGFWVVTPLLLDEKTVVLVQRGWVPRDVRDVQAVPVLSEHTHLLRVQGRLAAPPSKWLELQESQTTPTQGSSRIRHNIDITELRQQWGVSVAAVMLQTDPSDSELVRDWPMPGASASTNWGYAFQWFAMSATLLLLSFWTLIIRPLRHGSKKSH
ncbi:MAG: SURF1 family protein [Alphaproteobacteria bacterium]|nr:SURF1 family protein [Alphaproteobacteria bacterium]